MRERGDILFLEREFFLFRTGANVNAAQVPRDATPIFFPEKENGRRPSKRKVFPIASEQLEELQCLPIALPARGEAALSITIRFDLLLSSAVAQPLAALPPYGCGTPLAGAALPILQEYAVISVYRQSPQCGERSNAAISHAVCRRSTVTRASR